MRGRWPGITFLFRMGMPAAFHASGLLRNASLLFSCFMLDRTSVIGGLHENHIRGFHQGYLRPKQSQLRFIPLLVCGALKNPADFQPFSGRRTGIPAICCIQALKILLQANSVGLTAVVLVGFVPAGEDPSSTRQCGGSCPHTPNRMNAAAEGFPALTPGTARIVARGPGRQSPRIRFGSGTVRVNGR